MPLAVNIKSGLKLLCLILLILFLAWTGYLAWHTIRLVQLIPQVKNLKQDLSPKTAASLVRQASGDLAAIQKGIQPIYPLLGGLAGLPAVGPYLGQAEPVLEFANSLGRSGAIVLDSLDPVLQKLETKRTEGLQETAFQAIFASHEKYIEANRWMAAAAKAREKINPDLFPEDVRSAYQQLDENFPLIQAAVGFLNVAPQMLGSQQPQTYLILAQNHEELRATGGFISGIGTLVLDNGKVASVDIRDSYQIDDFSKGYPKPPQPLSQFMLAGYWVPRDANWSPDFPTAARNAQELYTLSTGVATQGVIAFDQSVLVSILGALGPVQIEGIDEAIAARNVEAYMQTAWGQGTNPGNEATWWEHRKDFMAVLGKSLLEALLQQEDPRVIVQLVRQVKESLEQGHLLFYLNDPDAQSWLKRSGWDGSLVPETGDFLLLGKLQYWI